MTKKNLFLPAILGLLLCFTACQKNTDEETSNPMPAEETPAVTDRTAPPSTISYQILFGTLPVSAVYNYRGRGGEPSGGEGGGGGLLDPAPDGFECTPSIRINNAAALSAATEAWAIGLVQLDNNLNPISERLYGDCPNCLPLDLNNAFSWVLAGNSSTRWDMFLIQFGAVQPVAEVTETFPCNSSDPGGNDTYGEWFIDLHQFNTWMGCAPCP